jgi:hypothetical protein
MPILTGVAILLALFFLGCSAPEPANLQAELDNVASCFFESVSLLQDRPAKPEEVGSFLKTAFDKLPDGTQEIRGADFSALRWNKESETLVTSTGKPISCRIVERTHDNYAPHGTAYTFVYEFVVPESPFRSRTSIELKMR